MLNMTIMNQTRLMMNLMTLMNQNRLMMDFMNLMTLMNHNWLMMNLWSGDMRRGHFVEWLMVGDHWTRGGVARGPIA
jgi:hypothetical protein